MLLTNLALRSRELSISRISPLLYFSAPFSRRRLQTQATGKPFRVLFLGRDEFSSTVLKELHSAQDVWSEIICLTQPETNITSGSISRRRTSSPLSKLARELGLPTHHIPLKRKDFRKYTFPEPFCTSSTSAIECLPSNYVLVTASFGRILTDKHLGLFQPGRRLNVHPSLLPKYRGPAPIQHAILNNDKETGVCVIEMTKKSDGIDAGELWGMEHISMPTFPEFSVLREELANRGGRLLVSTLRSMISGNAASTSQVTSGDCVPAPLIKSNHALLDFSKMNANEIHCLWRAVSHQKPLTTSYRLPSSFQASKISTTDATSERRWHSVQFTQLELVPNPPGRTQLPLHNSPGSYAFSKPTHSLYVRCSDESIIAIKRLKPAGGKEMDAQAFWNGVWAAVGRDRKKRVNEGLAKEGDDRFDGSERGLWTFGGVDLPSQVV
ncbi:formyl transferase [Crepidotus variabilis]|uniref:methionyl-tRNA formyltransferase n=1 Tax=Crepidotus variabilis TaxID=179855 RepID=A0A9P6EFI9_9AGAR|nr:formyl transferase [Crepidotus variabilis]